VKNPAASRSSKEKANMGAAAVPTYDKEDAAWEYFRGRITAVTFGTTPF
jgi:hypothetical protein